MSVPIPTATTSGARLPGSPRVVLPVLILAGVLALSVDVPVSRFCHVQRGGQFAHEFLEHVEPFGQPTGLVAICAALLLCDAGRGRASVRIALAAIGAGLSADVLKLCVARARPYHFFSFTSEDIAGGVWNSFRGLFPLFAGGSKLQSFPSAHSAFVAGFCVAMWAVYPKGKWLFVAVATLVAVQRVEGGSHFLSDTLWGAAVGYGFCTILFGDNRLARGFTRFECVTTS